jgi:flavin reductase (DIM6/NTAB) family NADH-FMN oxidoreductase RutF
MLKVEFSKMHRLFYPQVPLVLCACVEDRVSAMPVVSYAAVSESPPMMAVSCNPNAFTFKLAARARAFSLCLLDSSRLGAMEKLATISGAKVKDKLREAALGYHLDSRMKAPVIDGSVAVIGCVLHSTRKVGDHALLIGSVRDCTARGDFSDFWSYKKYRPILYTGWRDGLSTYKGS